MVENNEGSIFYDLIAVWVRTIFERRIGVSRGRGGRNAVALGPAGRYSNADQKLAKPGMPCDKWSTTAGIGRLQLTKGEEDRGPSVK